MFLQTGFQEIMEILYAAISMKVIGATVNLFDPQFIY